ncbi:CDP-alcohol phosphatidyltransferase family protein [Entomomonas asaccharolytica]|uniref:CDP-alcohol phosphatidyltransferase family protein n=1 Tax=Entomomonas asaccharolytica TaxID=2785331 RepID=A0A974RXA9_9GAMM|nr:CDP-alcohol phosphatidyltransferase family protein [Entomomonas asaccharolytica]QQP86091.1 CDP-alcohol phosphatidyltransferase family protein [Entomomonas asaccharolytica]
MISVYQLKPKFQALLRPLVQKLFDAKITANQVTIAACIGSLLVALIVVLASSHLWVFWLIPLWMFIRMALNAIDGMLAREFGQKSNLGAYFNELADVIADSALFLVFAFVISVNPMLVVFVVILSLLTEYAGVMGPLVGASRRYDGPMGKSDRALAFGVISAGIAIGWLPLTWINPLLWIIAGLLVYTLVNRIRQGLKEVANN